MIVSLKAYRIAQCWIDKFGGAQGAIAMTNRSWILNRDLEGLDMQALILEAIRKLTMISKEQVT